MAIYKQNIVDIDLGRGQIHRSFLNHSIGMYDQQADRFGIRVLRDGEAVDLTGITVQGVFMPPTGSPIAITGDDYTSVEENTAEVILPQACYNYEGNFTLAIKLVDATNTVTGTMRIVDGVVDNTHASGTVAPTGSVPTYQEVLAVYADMVTALETVDELDSAMDYSKNSTGNAVNRITGYKPLIFEQGYYKVYDDNREVDISTPTTNNDTGRNSVCCKCQCSAGDAFYIHTYGGASTAAAYGFLTNDFKAIFRGATNAMKDGIVIAPSNAAWIIINNKLSSNGSDYYAYKGSSVSLTDGFAYLTGDNATPFDWNSTDASSGDIVERTTRVHAFIPDDCLSINVNDSTMDVLMSAFAKEDNSYVGNWNGSTFAKSASWFKDINISNIANKELYNFIVCVRNENNTGFSDIVSAAQKVLFTFAGFDKRNENMAQGFENADSVVFEKGSISGANGGYLNGASYKQTRLRTKAFISDYYTGITVSKDGYQASVFKYNTDGSYIGALQHDGTTKSKAEWISDFIRLPKGGKYRVLVRHSDNSEILLSEELGIRFTTSELSAVQSAKESEEITYPYYGEKITLNRHELRMVKMLSIPTSKDSKSQQGACSYGDLLFQFYNTGLCDVFDLMNEDDNDPVYSFKLDEVNEMHCNIAMFGAEKYDSGDDFPLVYVNYYNENDSTKKGTCLVYRLVLSNGEITATLVQTLKVGFVHSYDWYSSLNDSRTYGNWAIDADNGFIYAYVIRDGDRTTKFFKFNLPALSAGDVTFELTDALDVFSVDYFNYIQDNCIVNGKIYIAAGYETVNPSIRVVNPFDHRYESAVKLTDLNLSFEPEGITLYDNSLILTGGGYGRRFTFE